MRNTSQELGHLEIYGGRKNDLINTLKLFFFSPYINDFSFVLG
jgi:hypothetical protein